MSNGLYIGRFQPFHLGHLSAVKQALEQVDRLIIGIGSSQYHHTPENPFTGHERQKMIESALQEEGIESKCQIFLIPDLHQPEKWVEHVISLIPPFDMVFVGNEGVVKELFEEKGILVKTVKKEFDISATHLRKQMKENGAWQKNTPLSMIDYLEVIRAEERIKQLYQD